MQGRTLHARLALLLAVAGCSGDAPATDSGTVAPVSSPVLAMARGWVDVEGGLIRIAAPRDGTIAEVHVEEGDAVVRDQILAVLDGRQAQIAVDAAQAELDQARAHAQVVAARLPPLQARATRIAAAADEGAATGQAADDAQGSLAELQAEIVAANAATALARQHVDAAIYELGTRTLRAPVAGRIVRRWAQVGSSVAGSAGAELFRLLPDGPRIVRAELDEASVAQVKRDMNAEVTTDDNAAPVHLARVLRIGEVFGPSRITDDPQQQAGAHSVECILQLADAELRVGQPVLVRFRR